MFRSGQKVGLYTLIEKLGRGGFGEVWLAEKRSQFVTKKVAVKLPHDEQVNFDAISQEATLWEQASGHPNVLPIIDADVYDGQVVIVSEYADGGSLADKLKREEKLPVQLAVELTIGILSGLGFLHHRKIIHRDIKPQNILLQGNTPRLADFGISRAMNTTVISSAIIGTDAYMSPEAFDGKRNAQTDIWSVGVVLYQLLKGSLPFPQEHPSERMFAVLTKEFVPLPTEVSPDLRRIVERALQKNPENRYQTAVEMREDLRRVLTFIENPSFAPTEVFHRSNLPELPFETPAPTVDAFGDGQKTGNDLPRTENIKANGETEIETFVNQTPGANRPAAGEPAPTETSIPPNSFVTEIKQISPDVSAEKNKPVSSPADQSLLDDTGRRNKKLVVAAALGLLLFFVIGSIVVFNRSNNSRVNDHSSSKSNKSMTSSLHFFQNGANKYGYKDSNERIVIEPKYDYAWPFTEGLAAVKENGKFGFIDQNGDVVIPFKFEDAEWFKEEKAPVKLNGQWGFIDRTGNFVIEPKYENAEPFSEGLAFVKSGGKWGYVDKNDTTIIPFKYGKGGMVGGEFKEGFAAVCINNDHTDTCGMIDKTGKEITPFKYRNVAFFKNGLAIVELNFKYGYVDKSGREVIPIKYDYAASFNNENFAEVTLNGRKLKIDRYGNETGIGPVETSASNTLNTNSTPNSLKPRSKTANTNYYKMKRSSANANANN